MNILFVCGFLLFSVYESSYSHSLLLSSTEYIHPVLNRVPAALSAQDVAQLNIVQVFL